VLQRHFTLIVLPLSRVPLF